ncbi:unnamed protein product, partial [Amoebophrya sp. A120]
REDVLGRTSKDLRHVVPSGSGCSMTRTNSSPERQHDDTMRAVADLLKKQLDEKIIDILFDAAINSEELRAGGFGFGDDHAGCNVDHGPRRAHQKDEVLSDAGDDVGDQDDTDVDVEFCTESCTTRPWRLTTEEDEDLRGHQELPKHSSSFTSLCEPDVVYTIEQEALTRELFRKYLVFLLEIDKNKENNR